MSECDCGRCQRQRVLDLHVPQAADPRWCGECGKWWPGMIVRGLHRV